MIVGSALIGYCVTFYTPCLGLWTIYRHGLKTYLRPLDKAYPRMKNLPKEYAVSQLYKLVGGVWCQSTNCWLYLWFLNSYRLQQGLLGREPKTQLKLKFNLWHVWVFNLPFVTPLLQAYRKISNYHSYHPALFSTNLIPRLSCRGGEKKSFGTHCSQS